MVLVKVKKERDVEKDNDGEGGSQHALSKRQGHTLNGSPVHSRTKPFHFLNLNESEAEEGEENSRGGERIQ